MRTKAVLLAILLTLAVGIAGCGGGDDDSTATDTVTETTSESGASGDPNEDGNAAAPSGDAVRSARVEIVDFAYATDPVTIEEGGKVTWINRDSDPHTATADDGSFDTGTLEEGKLGSESFKEPGTYAYICSLHPDMQGTVEVVSG